MSEKVLAWSCLIAVAIMVILTVALFVHKIVEAYKQGRGGT